VKIEITLDTARLSSLLETKRLQWVGGLGIVLACASCVPSPRLAGNLASPAALAATTDLPTQFSAEQREQVSRRVAELLVPVSSSPAEPFSDSGQAPEDHERSVNCLTQAIYYEARSEPEDGQRAVAQVVLNRVRHPAFPSTVCGVVFQGHQRTTGCQFSFTCDGSMNRGIRQPSAWMRARRIAEEAIGGSVYEPVGNATHYHTTAIRPYWAAHLRQSAIVGAHIFYRWAGNAGEASAFRQSYGGLEPEPAFWQAAASAGAGGVTVHQGLTPDSPIADAGQIPGEGETPGTHEEVALQGGGKVTIHRNARPELELPHEAPPQREALNEQRNTGVKVHVGAPPNAG